jgi:hypothetical protein
MAEIRNYTMNSGSGRLAGQSPAKLNLLKQVSLRHNTPYGVLWSSPVEDRNG